MIWQSRPYAVAPQERSDWQGASRIKSMPGLFTARHLIIPLRSKSTAIDLELEFVEFAVNISFDSCHFAMDELSAGKAEDLVST